MFRFSNGTYGFQLNSTSFEFHWPSEHHIDGYSFDLELQVRFYNQSINKMVGLAVLFSVGNATDIDFIAALKLDKIAEQTEQTVYNVTIGKFIDAYSLQPKFVYNGSDTAPPCSESIEWYVIKETAKINSVQLANFRKLWPDNKSFADGNGNNR